MLRPLGIRTQTDPKGPEDSISKKITSHFCDSSLYICLHNIDAYIIQHRKFALFNFFDGRFLLSYFSSRVIPCTKLMFDSFIRELERVRLGAFLGGGGRDVELGEEMGGQNA